MNVHVGSVADHVIDARKSPDKQAILRGELGELRRIAGLCLTRVEARPQRARMPRRARARQLAVREGDTPDDRFIILHPFDEVPFSVRIQQRDIDERSRHAHDDATSARHYRASARRFERRRDGRRKPHQTINSN
ncbi:hypothetical protein [Bradyrhizobium liaoningense]